jgi:hypothetical protein
MVNKLRTHDSFLPWGGKENLTVFRSARPFVRADRGWNLAKVRGCAFLHAVRHPTPADVSSKLLRRLLLAPVVLFLILELGLWIFVRIPLEPLKRLDLSNDLPGLKPEVRLVFDRNLTRYLDDAAGKKPPGTIRILCLGGSATFARLQNAEDTWWGRLGRQLQSQGHPVQVAAWGQDRTGIVASTAVAAVLMDEWQPDVVIGNFGFDDVVGQPLEYTYQPEKARGMHGPARTAGWKMAILKASQTARLSRWWARRNEASLIQNEIGRRDHWKNQFNQMRKKVNETAVQPLPARDPRQDPMVEFIDGWRVLRDLCNQHGAALVMTGEASLHDSTNNLSQQENLMAFVPLKADPGPDAKYVRPEPAWVEREMARYAEAAESFASSAGLPWVNLNGRVPRDLDHFFNDVILTDAGSAALTKEVLPVVEPVVQARRR